MKELIRRIDWWVFSWMGSHPWIARVWARIRLCEVGNCRWCVDLIKTHHYHFCGREDRRIGKKCAGKIEPPEWCPRRESVKSVKRERRSLEEEIADATSAPVIVRKKNNKRKGRKGSGRGRRKRR